MLTKEEMAAAVITYQAIRDRDPRLVSFCDGVHLTNPEELRAMFPDAEIECVKREWSSEYPMRYSVKFGGVEFFSLGD